MNRATTKPFKFGQYEVSPERRELKRDGEVVIIGDRAFDILVALATRPGQLVSKNELMQLVWPGTIVEENTIAAQVSILRRALGSEGTVIRTSARRGYQFVVDTSDRKLDQIQVVEPADLPPSLSALIGREAALRELMSITEVQRLTTLVGAGGIGKTRLAVELARRLKPMFGGRVGMSELAPLSQAEFVPTTITQALGLVPADGDISFDRLSSVLGSQLMLLVLDNCEHVIDASARIVETLLRAAPGLRIIATSREPLRVQGEHLYRVSSLDVPDDGEEDIAIVLASSALQLFDARLSHEQMHNSSEPEVVALKAKICRRLDGIPLAIELAAARAEVFGLSGLSDRLDDLFSSMTAGDRTSLPRQQTLTATLDWSFHLLTADERTVLARLCVFADQFTWEAAREVVTTSDISAAHLEDCLANLVSKSLVSVNFDGAGATYRLLKMTRTYGFAKLHQIGNANAFFRRHADYFCKLFESIEADWSTTLTTDWIAQFEIYLEDIRSALQWSFSDTGDPNIGVLLTASTVLYWLRRSLVQECLTNVFLALKSIEAHGTGTPRSAMKLYIARGKALLLGGPIPEAGKAFDRALEIADSLNDEDHQLIAIWGAWAFTYIHGPFDKLLKLAQRFCEITGRRPNRADRAVGERMLGMAYLCLGQLDNATGHLEAMLGSYRAPSSQSHLIRFGFDQTVAALSALAYSRWLQGFPDEAIELSEKSIERARSINHGSSVWYALVMCVCPIVLLTRGITALNDPYTEVMSVAKHFGMPVWQSRTQFWLGLLQMNQGNQDAYDASVAPSLRALGSVRHASYLTGFTSALCEQLRQDGKLIEAQSLIEPAIEHAHKVHDFAALPELLRVRGQLILAKGGPVAEPAAEAAFLASLTAANTIGGTSWRLRASTSLAQLLHAQNRRTEALAILEPVYASFSEGFETIDLLAAKEVLSKCNST
jgi:predicted ATPase/DNA-binding winged helix-turn-helix (wHTH) protein